MLQETFKYESKQPKQNSNSDVRAGLGPIGPFDTIEPRTYGSPALMGESNISNF
jgi:hypothetical protein